MLDQHQQQNIIDLERQQRAALSIDESFERSHKWICPVCTENLRLKLIKPYSRLALTSKRTGDKNLKAHIVLHRFESLKKEIIREAIMTEERCLRRRIEEHEERDWSLKISHFGISEKLLIRHRELLRDEEVERREILTKKQQEKQFEIDQETKEQLIFNTFAEEQLRLFYQEQEDRIREILLHEFGLVFKYKFKGSPAEEKPFTVILHSQISADNFYFKFIDRQLFSSNTLKNQFDRRFREHCLQVTEDTDRLLDANNMPAEELLLPRGINRYNIQALLTDFDMESEESYLPVLQRHDYYNDNNNNNTKNLKTTSPRNPHHHQVPANLTSPMIGILNSEAHEKQMQQIRKREMMEFAHAKMKLKKRIDTVVSAEKAERNQLDVSEKERRERAFASFRSGLKQLFLLTATNDDDEYDAEKQQQHTHQNSEINANLTKRRQRRSSVFLNKLHPRIRAALFQLEADETVQRQNLIEAESIVMKVNFVGKFERILKRRISLFSSPCSSSSDQPHSTTVESSTTTRISPIRTRSGRNSPIDEVNSVSASASSSVSSSSLAFSDDDVNDSNHEKQTRNTNNNILSSQPILSVPTSVEEEKLFKIYGNPFAADEHHILSLMGKIKERKIMLKEKLSSNRFTRRNIYFNNHHSHSNPRHLRYLQLNNNNNQERKSILSSSSLLSGSDNNKTASISSYQASTNNNTTSNNPNKYDMITSNDDTIINNNNRRRSALILDRREFSHNRMMMIASPPPGLQPQMQPRPVSAMMTTALSRQQQHQNTITHNHNNNVHCQPTRPVSARGRNWKQDIVMSIAANSSRATIVKKN